MAEIVDKFSIGECVTTAARLNSKMKYYNLLEHVNSYDIYESYKYLLSYCRKGSLSNIKWIVRRRIDSRLRGLSRSCNEKNIEHYLILPGSIGWIKNLIKKLSLMQFPISSDIICIGTVIKGFLRSRTIRYLVNDISRRYNDEGVKYIDTPLAEHMESIRELDGTVSKNFPILHKLRSFNIVSNFVSEFYNEITEIPVDMVNLSSKTMTESINSYEYAVEMFRKLKIDELIRMELEYLELDPDINGGYMELVSVLNSGIKHTCSDLSRIYEYIVREIKIK